MRLLNLKTIRLSREVSALKAELHAERVRNGKREDQLLNLVLEAASLKPLQVAHAVPASPVAAVSVKRTLTSLEIEDREFHADDAEVAGFSRQKGYDDWARTHQ